MLPKKNANQKGQALLIILLLMAVVLTVVLSVSSQSITEITISEHEEYSARALSAAEAGVEETLISGSGSGGSISLENDATYTTTVNLISPSGGEFVYPEGIKSGESVTFWLVSHDANGDLICTGEPCFQGDEMKFCWGSGGVPASALELLFFYDDDTTNKNWEPPSLDFENVGVKRLAYDPVPGTRTPSNNFTQSEFSCTISGVSFEYSTPTIDLSSTFLPDCDPSAAAGAGCLLMVRARLFYNEDHEQLIGISTPSFVNAMPAQGASIDSTGSFSDATRRISVYRSYPAPPDVFDSAVFSYGSIEK